MARSQRPFGDPLARHASGTIQRLRGGNAEILVLHGEHDVSTVQSLVRELDDARRDGAAVVVDLTQVEFLDSSILRVLLEARERGLTNPAGFALVAPPSSFASRVFALAAPTVIPTYADRGAAIASVTLAGS
jgi:anti-sigma B factor antagonist